MMGGWIDRWKEKEYRDRGTGKWVDGIMDGWTDGRMNRKR